MLSNRKLLEYRELRNYICFIISIENAKYEKSLAYSENMAFRKDCLDRIAFYKDVLAILSKNKDMLIDTD